jgi:hypothetical protein
MLDFQTVGQNPLRTPTVATLEVGIFGDQVVEPIRDARSCQGVRSQRGVSGGQRRPVQLD